MNLERANWTLKEGRDWHVAWFRECLKIIDAFTYQTAPPGANYKNYSNNRAVFEKGTNLCHYIRVSAVWGPGIIFLQLLTVSMVMGALFFMPLQVFGLGGYLTSIGVVAILATLVFGIYCLVDWAETTKSGKRLGDWLDRWVGDPIFRADLRTRKYLRFNNREGVSIWSMVWTFIVTMKQQVCPLINIKEDE